MFLPFQHLKATCIPWLVAPSSVFKASSRISPNLCLCLCLCLSLSLSHTHTHTHTITHLCFLYHISLSDSDLLLPPSYKDPCDYLGPIYIIKGFPGGTIDKELA